MNDQPAVYNNTYIIGISFISALGGYLFGFDFAVISGALPFLRVQFGLSPLWEGFLTGSLALGCIIGCLIAGAIADRYGRKPGLLTAALIFAASSLGMALSPSLTVFIAMRCAAGIGVGMASMLSPLYIAEISPAPVRGRNVAINQLTIVTGILVTNVVNYFVAGRGGESWRWMFGLGVVPSSLFFTGVLWLPESPRWLMMAGRLQEAQAILKKIGSESYVRSTIETIRSAIGSTTSASIGAAAGSSGKGLSVNHSPGKASHGKASSVKGAASSSYRAVFRKAVRPAVLLGITLAVFQQLCGINIVFNYTSTIFASVGASLDNQLLATVSIGIVNLLFTLVAMWQVDRLGRRPLMLIGSLGLSILYMALAFSLRGQWNTSLVALFVLLAIALYATTLAPVTWVLISEIFPNAIRGVASSVAIIALWAAYFVLVFTFPLLAAKLGTYGPFYFYAGICLLGFLFVRSKVKETKGKTLEELEVLLQAH